MKTIYHSLYLIVDYDRLVNLLAITVSSHNVIQDSYSVIVQKDLRPTASPLPPLEKSII